MTKVTATFIECDRCRNCEPERPGGSIHHFQVAVGFEPWAGITARTEEFDLCPSCIPIVLARALTMMSTDQAMRIRTWSAYCDDLLERDRGD